MKNHRENLLSLYKKQGYDFVPVDLELCPSQVETFKKTFNTDENYRDYFDFSEKYVSDLTLPDYNTKKFEKYFNVHVDKIDHWGIGYQNGSEAAKHMHHMVAPMKDFTTISEFQQYPYPDYLNGDISEVIREVKEIHDKGYIAKASMACTVWEISWYLRSMEQLMSDMILEEELAAYHLDRITEISCHRAREFAKAGVDLIITGDDVGMQRTLMMSEDMYTTWIKPRFRKIVQAAKEVNPEILIEYHSCGYVEPFIPHFIDCGIDILNPIQPESMDFEKLFDLYHDQISFKGTIGTQTTMPFGSVDDVRKVVRKNLDYAGKKGGLFICPTHMIEPEVPFENIMAYIEACKEYK
ncbi:MAG: hypothetical protein JXQ23_03550 [Clostridia bacterium]|nr:hypothetical protein [Clostridia bacterium]